MGHGGAVLRGRYTLPDVAEGTLSELCTYFVISKIYVEAREVVAERLYVDVHGKWSLPRAQSRELLPDIIVQHLRQLGSAYYTMALPTSAYKDREFLAVIGDEVCRYTQLRLENLRLT